MKKMKIAIVCDRVYPFFKGGVEKRYWDIAENLIKKGHEVHFYTGQWPGMEKEVIVNGIVLHGVYTVKNFYVNGKKSIKESLIYTLKLFPYLLKADFDLIDCDQFPLFSIIPSRIACTFKNKPLIVTWHEVWDKYWFKYIGWKGFFGYIIEKIVAQLPTEIISVSEHTTQGLIQVLKVNKNKIKKIPSSIDTHLISKIKSSDIKSSVIFVGRLLTHKNVDILIKAIKLVRNQIPAVKCVIAGDGPERIKLIELADKIGINESVEFLGSLEDHGDIIALIKSSKALVLPSTREGFGLVVIEAMACGTPVITINHKDNAARYLIEEEKNGFTCQLDEEEISNSIIRILKNNLGSNMKKSCLDLAQNYDWIKMLDETERVYQMSLKEVYLK